MAAPLLASLRPKPFRGDVIAAGIVVLVTLVYVLEVRFAGRWGVGVHLVYAALTCALVTTMGRQAPMEGGAPRAYQSALYVGAFALALPALVNLADVLGADGLHGAGARAWVLSLAAALALSFATQRNSAVCTLLGALSGGVAVLSAVEWLSDPGIRTFRWVLLVLMAVYAVVAVGQRDRRRRHGVALVDASGLASAAIGVTLATNGALGSVMISGAGQSVHVLVAARPAWGWELLLLAVGFGLIAYSSVDREPGPAYLGVLNLGLFVLLAAYGDLFGWPLLLLIAAAALLTIGLRPTTPAPPPPDVDAPEPPPLPLR